MTVGAPWSRQLGTRQVGCTVLGARTPLFRGNFFREWGAGMRDGTLDTEELSVRYGIQFDMESVASICAEHGLVHPLVG